jgi:hypothetical protein
VAHQFRSALDTGQALDVSTISADDKCDLGRWLKGEGKVLCGTNPAYQKLVEQHHGFHRCAGTVASGIARGKKPDAEQILALEFKTVSMSTVAAISALKKLLK